MLVIAFHSATQDCGEGCLSCAETGDCLVADTRNYYYIEGKTAVQSTDAKCVLLSNEGECLACTSGYYLDNNTSSCVAVPAGSLIDHCSTYNTANSCSACDNDYYLDNNACVAVQQAIANCKQYSTEITCAGCEEGYLVSPQGDGCVEAPDVPNCSDFTYVRCKACEEGYTLNQNMYLHRILRSSTAEGRNASAQFAEDIQEHRPQVAPQSVCFALGAQNCLEFNQSTRQCVTCEDGFQLNVDGHCISNQETRIAYCMQYTSAAECVRCESGYLLEDGICVQITEEELISSCIKYAGATREVVCLECHEDYYLVYNTCVRREHAGDRAIEHCAVLVVDADECEACVPGYVLANSGLLCKPEIANCVDYAPTGENQPLRCVNCASGYALSTTEVEGVETTQCLPAAIEHCAEHAVGNQDQCIRCEEGYILEEGTCIDEPEKDNCIAYRSADPEVCERCDPDTSMLFIISTHCATVTNPIDNCAVYGTGTLEVPVCKACDSGYSLRDNTCEAITIENCVEMNGNQCIRCADGFASNYDGTSCIPPFTYIQDNCLIDSTVQTTESQFARDVACSVCDEAAVPYNFIAHFVCLSSDEILQTTNGVDVLITGCLKYSGQMSCLQCDMEGDLPFLDTAVTPHTCVATCSDDRPYFVYRLRDDWQISQFNVCYNPGGDLDLGVVENCAAYAPSLTSNGKAHICIRCKENAIPLLDPREHRYSNADARAVDSEAIFPSVFARFPAVTCPPLDGVATMAGATINGLIENCLYYKLESQSSYSCLRCEIGYTGTVNETGMVAACTRDTAMAKDSMYNLDPAINNIASVHRCANPDEIPFIAYHAASETDPTFDQFSRYSTTPTEEGYEDTTGEEPNIACRPVSAATFGIADADFGVVSNCGLGVLLTNSLGVGDGVSSFGTYCAACKPGYAATTHETFDFVKTSCTPVEHCDPDSKIFNGCSDCASGYVLAFNAEMETISFSRCLAIPAELSAHFDKCYAAEAASSDAETASRCRVCNPGFQLNADNVCEMYTPEHCNANSFRFSAPNKKAALEWSLWQNQQGVGCNRCSDSFYAVMVVRQQAVCLSSEWVVNTVNTLDAKQTQYIPNCRNYQADANTLRCHTCDGNYILSEKADGTTGTECIDNAKLANCATAISADACARCRDPSFGLVNGQCVQGNIENCTAYNYNTDDAEVKCRSCAPNYYLDTATNTCGLGAIQHCDVFAADNPNKCESCSARHAKVQNVETGFDYCYPLDPSLGCEEANITHNIMGARVACVSCSRPEEQIIVAPVSRSDQVLCMEFIPIAHCQSYHIGTMLGTSDFTCRECANGFHLRDNQCVPVAGPIEGCAEHEPDRTRCLRCEKGLKLTEDRTECIESTAGIEGCRRYVDKQTCAACGKGTYLSDNACIEADPPIDNCRYYLDNDRCETCETGFVLQNNTCEEAIARNCATFQSPTACATCIESHVLETTDGVTHCISMTKEGCLVVDINPPYNCLECDGQRYTSNGECLAAQKIEHCEAYDGAATCSRCASGFVLNADATVCQEVALLGDLHDPRCANIQMLDTPICSRCAPGYFFKNGACTGLCNDQGTEGCIVCDPNNPTSCHICASGYFMDKNGRCNAMGLYAESASKAKLFALVAALMLTTL